MRMLGSNVNLWPLGSGGSRHFGRVGDAAMIFRKRTVDDFASEIEAHLALETDRLIAEGMPPVEARLAARRRFGNVTAVKERRYESHRILWWDGLRQDLRAAARSIARYPVSALVAVISLAAGVGATTATLTIRTVIFHRPPPAYSHPEQLSRIQVGRPDRPIVPGSAVPGGLFTIWRDTLGPAIAAATPSRVSKDVRTADRTDTIPVRAASSNLFPVLGVAPVLGRDFSDHRTDEAILSYRLWLRLFDQRRDAIGETIWIDNQPHTVVGVLPPRFWFGDMMSAIWVPLAPSTASSQESFQVVVRRAPPITPDRLAPQLQVGLTQYASGLSAGERPLQLKVSSVNGTPVGDAVSIMLPYVLATCVLLTLLIACANVAILMIAQWTAREHETAIRASLGASRGRIVRALLTESLLIAIAGGALGVCVTFALRGVIVYRGGIGASLFDLTIDPVVLMQSALITLVSGMAAGLAPALYETRRLHANPLCAIVSPDRIRQRWRHALVVLEITLTVALLVVTSSMVDGYQRARAAQLGFPTRPLLTARVENPSGVPAPQILDIVAQLPGVAVAAAATSVPFAASGPHERVAADSGGRNAGVAERATVSAGFFAALDVPIRAGRAFAAIDLPPARNAIVNETLARRLFPGSDAVGRQAWIGQTAYDIVGVVADYSTNPLPSPDDAAKLFLPMAARAPDVKRLQLLIRAANDPVPLVQAVRRAVRDAAPGNIVTGAFTLDQIIVVMGQEMLVGTAPLAPLVAIGMLLTAAGIYGVLAFAVARRSRELAVRVAIGATNRDLVRLVTSHTFRLLALGSTCGIALTSAVARIVRASGGGGSIYDPAWPAFVVPIILVATIGALATWIPSRRVTRINPAVLLRTA
jgi:putative ABC transport system permease protein